MAGAAVAVDISRRVTGLARQLAGRPGGVTRSQLAQTTRISGNRAWQVLAALAAEGALRREGAGRTTHTSFDEAGSALLSSLDHAGAPC